MKRLKLYADTSVFGGCFDEEFSYFSLKLFDEIRAGKFLLLVSATTVRELEKAPEEVRRLVDQLPDDAVEKIALSDEIAELRDAYYTPGWWDLPRCRTRSILPALRSAGPT